MKNLTTTLLCKVAHDIAVASSPEDVQEGVLVATERGVVWIQEDPYGYPTYGEENTGPLRDWHLSWSLVEDLNTEDYGISDHEVWVQAAKSTERLKMRIWLTEMNDPEFEIIN